MYIFPISIASLPSLLDKRDNPKTDKLILLNHVSNHLWCITGQLGELKFLLMYAHRFFLKTEEFPYLFLYQCTGKEMPRKASSSTSQLKISAPLLYYFSISRATLKKQISVGIHPIPLTQHQQYAQPPKPFVSFLQSFSDPQ